MDKNIVWHEVNTEKREELMGHKAALLWFTGLSGCGKSTIAAALQERLSAEGKKCYVLDGDNIRHGLNSDLGFSASDRVENIRRIGEVGKLFVDAGIIAITSFISPYTKDRDTVRAKLDGKFVEIFVKCPVEECEARDPKGLYKKARNGEISDFTGVSAPYEEPLNPEVIVDSSKMSVAECVDKIYDSIKEKI
ncbi:adenylyl-sulfate kinase [Candidatus Woesearchaeota archaeon]|nr:adenylyl-sulfate kinase [Candidatus Woesearchaeota archaeon]